MRSPHLYRFRAPRSTAPCWRLLFRLLGLPLLLTSFVRAAPTYSFKVLNAPGATMVTSATGISGGNIVGCYLGSSLPVNHGFIYNGTGFVTLNSWFNSPGGGIPPTYGISGGNIVGGYLGVGLPFRGFVFNGTAFTSIEFPGAMSTDAFGIDGGNVVGDYVDSANSSGFHGYVLRGNTFTTLDDPLATIGTFPKGINGGNIVGEYQTNKPTYFSHGFFYSGSGFITIDDPLGKRGTHPTSISGPLIAGYYHDGHHYHGFVYDLRTKTFSTVDFPVDGIDNYIFGIQGTTLVGSYVDKQLIEHGFIATFGRPPAITTEPASKSVRVGHGASFHVAAIGSTPLAYQWLCNGQKISGATGTTYTLASATVADAGNYRVKVTNQFGSILSLAVKLKVTQH